MADKENDIDPLYLTKGEILEEIMDSYNLLDKRTNIIIATLDKLMAQQKENALKDESLRILTRALGDTLKDPLVGIALLENTTKEITLKDKESSLKDPKVADYVP